VPWFAARSTQSIRPSVVVLRSGTLHSLPPADLVVGDLVWVEVGQNVPADGRLVTAISLQVSQASLTGESRAVDKQADVLCAVECKEVERSNMLLQGMVVVRGRGLLLVTATGARTASAKIAAAALAQRPPLTPLQRSLRALAFWLTLVSAGCSLLVMALGYACGMQTQRIVLMGSALAFATIPEELPLLIKTVMAVGALGLSAHSILVRRLSAAESLAAVSVILSDKTGTLTLNKLSVKEAIVAPASSGRGRGAKNGVCDGFGCCQFDVCVCGWVGGCVCVCG
jgi:Ca2+-transporting ATPase